MMISPRSLHNIKISIALLLVFLAYASVIMPVFYYIDRLDISTVIPLIGSGVAIVTGILALLKDFILDSVNHSVLKLDFFPHDKRDCHATKFTNPDTGQFIARVQYFRVRVVNYGWTTAEDVEVNLEEVRKFSDNGYETDQDFMPLRLFWSHWKQHRFELSIPSGTFRYCDFGFVQEPNSRGAQENAQLLFWFDVFMRPHAGRTTLLPEKYEIKLVAFGKNARPTKIEICIDWKGIWDDNIDEFLKKGAIFS
ncbi:hypothetical protein HZA56_02455 [Candidatus Poribacteria bacterium]|nr:hypothetical protein [Candidatus Poribacteria bacterium]